MEISLPQPQPTEPGRVILQAQVHKVLFKEQRGKRELQNLDLGSVVNVFAEQKELVMDEWPAGFSLLWRDLNL